MAHPDFYKGHANVVRPSGNDKQSWLQFECGYCGRAASGAVVALFEHGQDAVRWIWCPSCGEPSAKATNGDISPGALSGFEVEGLPSEVAAAYSEARRCMSVNAYTAAELVSRKILMHVAVDKGAKEGGSFGSYIDHLEKSGYITPPMKGWVDLIRQHGNESTHRLSSPDRNRAEGTLMFTGEMLRIVYEMEHKATIYTASPSNTHT